MHRKTVKSRPDIEAGFDRMGFQYHKTVCQDGNPYWSEGTAYEFSLSEIEIIESATDELHKLCLETVGDIVASGDYPEGFRLSNAAKFLIEQSWNRGDMHIYGRFDLVFDPESRSVKMYEYNADTPTSLLEAAIAQWEWLEQMKLPDQFNSLHEKLIARWRLAKTDVPNPVLYLYATKKGEYEDWGNVGYMADAAMQAGWSVHVDEIENLGWDRLNRNFVDLNEMPIRHAFKLYPWEWMMDEEFGKHIAEADTRWYEPAWKMLLSNKAILPVLWQRYPNHPNLLPAFFEEASGFIRKPILGREGANVHRADHLLEGSHFISDYDVGYVYQEYAPLPEFDGNYPVIGSWIVGDEPAGIGIREDRTLVSGNGSHFVPHYFLED